MSSISDILTTVTQAMTQIGDLTGQTNQVALDSALIQAQMALSMAVQEAEGLAAQLELNDIATGLNVMTDLQALGVKDSLMLASKAMEASVQIAQFREKTLGMLMTIADQRIGNTWGRMKQLSQGFKF